MLPWLVRRARAKADLDRFFDLSADLITVADFEGRFRRVNPAVEQILGYTQEEFLARPYIELVHPDDRDRTAAEAASIREGKPTRSFENRYLHKDGSWRVLQWTATPVVDDGLMYGIARDVTKRREADAEVARLAEEQAALRHVATLVAGDASQEQVVGAIADSISRLFGTDDIAIARFEGDDTRVILASCGASTRRFPVGSRQALGGADASTRIVREGRAVRIDDYQERASGPIADTVRASGVRGVVGAPVVVEGRLWGAITIGTTSDEPLPPDTEARLSELTDLMATAIANTESRAEVERLADEQAALRRVATLVAEGAVATAVFDAVAAEMESLLAADGVTLNRYEPNDEVTIVAHRGSDAQRVPIGMRVSHRGENVATLVRRSRRSARMEHRAEGQRSPTSSAESWDVRASAGAPIVVDGRLWGVAIASWRGEQSPPPDTEKRMAQFSRLLDTAIANADSREQLTASRARLVTAADEARRRVVRDLHDGAQQRLVNTIVTLKLAHQAFGDGDGRAEALVAEALEEAEWGNAELRELAHGILPAVLARGGLRAGLDSVVSRLDVPVRVDVPAERFPSEIEASAYFIVAEALTNVIKHSRAARADVRVSLEGGALLVEVQDDGIGGADPVGHGLVGMADRVTALGGRLNVESPSGGGTVVAATLPLPGA